MTLIYDGNKYVAAPRNLKSMITDVLPVDNYIVRYNERKDEYSLEPIDRFGRLDQYYGDIREKAHRIFSTFESRPNSTGAILSGERGSGKTLLAKLISTMGYDKGIPTIVINSPFKGDNFAKFLQDIHQPCIVIFDEFEKVYKLSDYYSDKEDDQGGLLTILDGIFPSKKLFILTCNKEGLITDYIFNRPGRMFYHFSFSGISKDIVIEYCQNHLEDLSKLPSIERFHKTFPVMTFDILTAIVEEMNRYGEDIDTVTKYLNVRAERCSPSKFNVTHISKGEILDHNSDRTITDNPLAMEFKYFGDFNNGTVKTCFSSKDFKGFDEELSGFVFEKDDFKIVLTPA